MAAFSITIITLIVLISSSSASSLNFTTLLSSYPDLSHFTSLITTTSLIKSLTFPSSLTILAVPNPYLQYTDSYIADVILYHILPTYFSPTSLRHIPTTGSLFPTFYQSGFVNISRNSSNGSIYIKSPIGDNALILTLIDSIEALHSNISIFTVNSLLIPSQIDHIASDSESPIGINITQALMNGQKFNVALSLLSASDLIHEFESEEDGAGLTIFMPTDEAFANLSPSRNLQSLTAEMKAVVLRFHVLHSYYPLGSLESIINPVQPTLATESIGAGRFTLNIKKVNGSVVINTGIVQASVTQTVIDQNPVAIFGVSKVLLPKEVFGKNPIFSSSDPGTGKVDQAPRIHSLGFESPSPAPAPSTGSEVCSELVLMILCISFCLMVL